MTIYDHSSVLPGGQYVELEDHLAVVRDRDLYRGAMAAQDLRERAAGELCGCPTERHGCDWPDAVAEELLSARRELAEWKECAEGLARAVDYLQPGLRDEDDGFSDEKAALSKFDSLKGKVSETSQP